MTDPITALTGYAALLLFLFGGTALYALWRYGATEVFGAIARDYEDWIDDRWK